MRQRLGIAEIVMKSAEVAILDEPTSGLDPHATHELLEMIRGLKKAGVAVLISSHLLDRVQSVCDRVALFNKGKIALMGTRGRARQQGAGRGPSVPGRGLGHRRRRRARAASRACRPSWPTALRSGGGAWRVIADRDVRAAVAQRIVSSGGSLTRLADLQPSLEEVYTRYFQEALRQCGSVKVRPSPASARCS